MEIMGKGLLNSVLLVSLMGCSPFQSSKIVFTKGPDAPPPSSGSIPKNITPPTNCTGAVTVRLIYSPSSTGLSVTSCQQFQLQNGTYAMGPAINCSGDISLQSSALNFSALSHSCSGFINLSQQGSVTLNCTGSLYNSYVGDYEFRTTTSGPSASDGITLLGQFCQATSTNSPPTITNPGNQTNTEGDSVSLRIFASDPNGSSISYQATGLPAGLSIDSTTGLISGTVSTGDASSSPFSIVITATNSVAASSIMNFIWYVNPLSPPPPPPPPPPSTRSVTLAWDVVTTNSDGTPITNLAGYIMYYTDVQGDWSRNAPITVTAPTNTGQIPNVVIGKTYYFAVSAFNTSYQESAKSQVVTYTP